MSSHARHFTSCSLLLVASTLFLEGTAQAQEFAAGAEVARDTLKYNFGSADNDALIGLALGARGGYYITLERYPSLKVGAELRVKHSRFGLPEEEEEIELADGSIFIPPDRLTITSVRPGVRASTTYSRLNAAAYTHLGYSYHHYSLPDGGGRSSLQNHMLADVGVALNAMVFPCHTVPCVEVGAHAETQFLFLGFDTPEQKPAYWLTFGLHAAYIF